LALGGGEWSASCPGRFTPGERVPSTHWIGHWVGHRAGLDSVTKRKISLPYWKWNSCRPARSLVDEVTELTRLLLYLIELFMVLGCL